MKKIDCLLVALVGLFLGVILSSLYFMSQNTCPDIDTSEIVANLQSQRVDSFDYYKRLSDELALKKTTCNPNIHVRGCEGTLESIALELNGAREYALNEFDCTEKANLLSDTYEELGYKSDSIVVNVDCESGLFDKATCTGKHQIVKLTVYMEAVKDDDPLIKPENYEAYGIRK